MSIQLNRAEFKNAFERTFGSDETAPESYLRLWRQLVSFFQWKGYVMDAEDMAQEVLDRMFRKVANGYDINGYGGHASAYAMAVARYVAMEYGKRGQHFLAVSSSNHLEAWPNAETVEVLERERLLNTLDECLNELPPQDRDLLMRFYDLNGSERFNGREKVKKREKLASELGISSNALRVRVYRLRNHLRNRMKRKLAEPDREVRRAHS